jgi:D-alanyl-D-alanine carboxypeptidase
VHYSVAGIDASGDALHRMARLEVASVTKTFVAALVLTMAEDRMLALDDDVAVYLPGVLRDDARITVRALLNHTSGLPDYYKDAAFLAEWRENSGREWAAHELIEVAAGLPRHVPGVFSYASTNYVLIGLIVESVTGRSVADALRARILGPLSLDATQLPRAAAAASGGLTSTADDVARFLTALMRGDVVHEASRREMLATVPSDWPESQGYGLGIERIESLMGSLSPCGAVWGHLGFGRRATTIALATPDAARQVVVTASAMLTNEAAWALLGRASWAALCPEID